MAKKNKKVENLQKEIELLKIQNEKLKNFNQAVCLLGGIILILFALYFFVVWLKDIAIPTVSQRFTEWLEKSDFNRGFFSGFSTLAVLWLMKIAILNVTERSLI